MIPLSFLKKMDTYEVEFHDGKVKVTVVDQACSLDDKLFELRNLLKIRVVGLDFIREENTKVLVLCIGSRCLIIHIGRWAIDHCNLKTFLGDKTICFVGVGMPNILTKMGSITTRSVLLKGGGIYSSPSGIKCESGVEVGYLAARVLKKHQLFKNMGLAELAGEVGIDVKVLPVAGSGNNFSDWKNMLYSEEQIKRTIYNAYVSYAIGNKVLAGL